jgi:hypothetical protein
MYCERASRSCLSKDLFFVFLKLTPLEQQLVSAREKGRDCISIWSSMVLGIPIKREQRKFCILPRLALSVGLTRVADAVCMCHLELLSCSLFAVWCSLGVGYIHACFGFKVRPHCSLDTSVSAMRIQKTIALYIRRSHTSTERRSPNHKHRSPRQYNSTTNNPRAFQPIKNKKKDTSAHS